MRSSRLNRKNLLLAVAAAVAIAQAEISGGEEAVAYLVFALIGAIGVAAPVVIYFASGTAPPSCSTGSSAGWRTTTP